jgi:hypothetical protein
MPGCRANLARANWFRRSLYPHVNASKGLNERERGLQPEGSLEGGFPNLFIVTGPQGGGGSFNFTDVIYAHADYLIWTMQNDARARRGRR